jgi:hypothetical protein
MNKSNLRSNATVMAEILCKMARRGCEVEFKPDRFHLDLMLGHTRPLSPGIIVTLRKNGFDFCFLDNVKYTDADGKSRFRSHFRCIL